MLTQGPVGTLIGWLFGAAFVENLAADVNLRIHVSVRVSCLVDDYAAFSKSDDRVAGHVAEWLWF